MISRGMFAAYLVVVIGALLFFFVLGVLGR
ncbi:hypothetical protein SAMN04489726_0506 [Allokutzneria albata]|uniref:Uncharacterized protein n=1 Tax=Allokutzneria albata TaxID=211114 RepID=A0A1G9RM03_ALLAB|nr:hypothetical protein SAMN04489726_0506 [Allokutzneria albata]